MTIRTLPSLIFVHVGCSLFNKFIPFFLYLLPTNIVSTFWIHIFAIQFVLIKFVQIFSNSNNKEYLIQIGIYMKNWCLNWQWKPIEMFLRIFNASLNIFTTMNQCNMIKKRINLFICFFSLESSHRYSKIFLVHSFIHLNWSHSTQQTKLIKFNYFTVREFLLIKLIATVCIPHWSISSTLVNCITLFAFLSIHFGLVQIDKSIIYWSTEFNHWKLLCLTIFFPKTKQENWRQCSNLCHCIAFLATALSQFIEAYFPS